MMWISCISFVCVFVCVCVCRSSWEQVFQSLWQRYPNPYSKHVLSEDIVDRWVWSCSQSVDQSI